MQEEQELKPDCKYFTIRPWRTYPYCRVGIDEQKCEYGAAWCRYEPREEEQELKLDCKYLTTRPWRTYPFCIADAGDQRCEYDGPWCRYKPREDGTKLEAPDFDE